VEGALTETAEQLRSRVEAEVEAVMQTLATEGDEMLRRLDYAKTQLRQHLDDLDALAARCFDVNLMIIQHFCIFYCIKITTIYVVLI